MSGEKQKALGIAISQIEKEYGKGSIMKLGDASKMKVEAVSTGSISLDHALGVGGLPRGRIIEIFGPESGGKTTVSLHAIAEAQKNGGVAAFIDAEHSLDPAYAKKLGVDIENLLISQPDYGEQALEIVETLVRSGAIDIIVVDSVAALVPKTEVEGDMGQAQMGLQARLMSQALRKLTAVINKSKTVVIFVNQLRMKVGIMFGNPEVTPGGRALKFYSSIRLDVRSIERLKEGEKIVGTRTRIKVVKNKVAPPFRETIVTIRYGEGVEKEGDLLNTATKFGIINKSGTWYIFDGNRMGQGQANAANYIKEHPETLIKIKDATKLALLEDPSPAEEKKPEKTAVKKKK